MASWPGDLAEGDTAQVDFSDGPDGRGEYAFEKKAAPAKAKAEATAQG